MDTVFNNLGVDVINGVQILSDIGVHPEEFVHDPIKFQQMKDIVSYANKVPDSEYLIRKAMSGKDIKDKIGYLWGYVELNKKKDYLNSEVKKIEEELNFYNK